MTTSLTVRWTQWPFHKWFNGYVRIDQSMSVRQDVRDISHERASLTRIGRSRGCSLEYLPSLVLSHTECSDSSGHTDWMIVLTDLKSLAMWVYLEVPLGHYLIPYITMLNLWSLADIAGDP